MRVNVILNQVKRSPEPVNLYTILENGGVLIDLQTLLKAQYGIDFQMISEPHHPEAKTVTATDGDNNPVAFNDLKVAVELILKTHLDGFNK